MPIHDSRNGTDLVIMTKSTLSKIIKDNSHNVVGLGNLIWGLGVIRSCIRTTKGAVWTGLRSSIWLKFKFGSATSNNAPGPFSQAPPKALYRYIGNGGPYIPTLYY